MGDNQESRHETDIKTTEEWRKNMSFFKVHIQNYSTIASGATIIGSAERAPDDIII
jgi:hypothetical protein